MSPGGGKNYCITAKSTQILDLLLGTYETAIQKNLELTETQNELKKLNEKLEEKIEEETAALRAEIVEHQRAEQKLKQSTEKLRKVMEEIIHAMAVTVEMRDPYTAGHQRRTAYLARAIAAEMELPKDQIEGIFMAGVIHDIGKISVPAEILCKPGRLNDAEFNLMKNHPLIGYDILKTIEFPGPWPGSCCSITKEWTVPDILPVSRVKIFSLNQESSQYLMLLRQWLHTVPTELP